MLKITRYPGEAFVIGDDVRVVIEHVGGQQVRLAIESPPEITVYREEVFERIQAEKAARG